MADELSHLLGSTASRHEREVQADVSAISARIIRGARSRRRVRAAVTAASSALGVGLIAGASVLALGPLAGGEAAPALPVTTVSPPAPSSDPSPAEHTSIPSPAGGSGEITSYPPLAPARGAGFPAAYEMQVWVWDYVGQGWRLETVGTGDMYGTTADAVVDLVSPDGERFRIMSLDAPMASGARVVSWREQQREAVVAWSDPDGLGHAAEVDLMQGAVSEIVFSMPHNEASMAVDPVAVNATGEELWLAVSDAGSERYYRWSSDRGWTVSALSQEVFIGDGGFALPAGSGAADAVREDGAAVMLERRPTSGGIEMAFYDVAADRVATATLVEPESACRFAGWSDDGEAARYSCAAGETRVVFSAAPDPRPGGTEVGDPAGPGEVAARSTIGWERPTWLPILKAGGV